MSAVAAKRLSDVVVSVAVYDRIELETERSLGVLDQHGAAMVRVHGCSDVGWARCKQISLAHEIMRRTARTVALFVDADMVVPCETAFDVCRVAREMHGACSARYVLGNESRAAVPWKNTLRWLTGMGCLAVSQHALERLAELSLVRADDPDGVRIWTWGGPASAQSAHWIGEDYRFCARLDGVLLSNERAGHVKRRPLWPEDASWVRSQWPDELPEWQTSPRLI